MAISLYAEPKLENPDMVVGWPGIGNIGIIAVDALRAHLQAQEFGQIEPWDFFYPRKVIVKDGLLTELEFPTSKFYYRRLEKKDLIIFIGEEQPTDSGRVYAEGKKAYQMANLVLDVAEKFGCRRVYTSGAAVALSHHTLKPKVWATAVSGDLLAEARKQQNIVMMSQVEGIGGQGSITGLNGLLLGVAKKRGVPALCLMGEIPDYLSQAPFPYPRASKAVLEILTAMLEISVDFSTLDDMAAKIDSVVESIYQKLSPDIKERLEQRKTMLQIKPETITEEDERWIKEHIEDLFKKGGGTTDERPS